MASWIRNLKLVSVPSTGSAGLQITIASFNILAETYLTPKSHPNLPSEYEEAIFEPHHRRQLLFQTIQNLVKTFDVLCLQEVDAALWEEVVTCFAELGYDYVHTYRGTTKVTRYASDDANSSFKYRNSETESRSDGCAIFYCSYKWECFAYESVQFDDLVEEYASSLQTETEQQPIPSSPIHTPHNPSSSIKSSKPSSTDIIQSYNSHNTALIIALKCVIGPNFIHEMIIANMHLYWQDSNHPDIQISQAHYLTTRIKEFVDTRLGEQADRIPIVLCGDAHSKPNSVVHQYLTNGYVDPRRNASWAQRDDLQFPSTTIITSAADDDDEEAQDNLDSDDTHATSKEHSHNHEHGHNHDDDVIHNHHNNGTTTSDIHSHDHNTHDEHTHNDEDHHHDEHSHRENSMDVDSNHNHTNDEHTHDEHNHDGHSHEHHHGHATAPIPRKQMKFNQVIGWLKEEKLTSPYPNLKSAYSLEMDENFSTELLSFTTVTSDSAEVYDYILFESSMLEQKAYLEVPMSLQQLNETNITNGHLLPSDEWPSDHLAIGASFRILSQRDRLCACPDPQQALLNCGCFIKNTFTMFEMAELRKQKKLESETTSRPASFLPFA